MTSAMLVSLALVFQSRGSRTPQGVTQVPSGPPPVKAERELPKPVGKPADPLNPLKRSPLLGEVQALSKGKPLTLSEALAIALTLNPALAQAGENLAVAHGRVGEARSQFLPTVSAGPAVTDVSRLVEPAYVVQATVPLDISRLLSSATEQAQFQEIAARIDVNRIRNDVAFRVESAFYTSLRAEALVQVAKENLQNSLDRLHDAQARFKARAVAYIDVVRAQTDVADAQRTMIQARSFVSASLAGLAETMGVDVTSPFVLDDTDAVKHPPTTPAANAGGGDSNVIVDPNKSKVEAESLDVQAQASLELGPEFHGVLAEALRDRPELLEADANLEAAKKGVQIARRSELPSLSLGVGYFYTRSVTGGRVNEPQAFIGLNFPLFDGGLAKSRVLEAKASVSSAITGKRVATDAVTLDVQNAYLALVQARDQVAVAGQALEEARAAFDLARVRYNTGVTSRAGTSPLLEVSDAQAALTLAEQNQVNALYDYNTAQTQLDRAAGRFAYVETGPGSKAPSGLRAGERLGR